MVINVNITDKRATVIGAPVIVCGNADYAVEFTFDSAWDAYDTKTARFAYRKDGAEHFQDIIFTGNRAGVPVLSDVFEVRVGVFAGDLQTSTPARVLCLPSIRCGSGAPDDPAPSVYDQLMEMLRQHVYMRSDGGYIQYSPDGRTWVNIIAVADILTEDNKTEIIDAVLDAFPVAEMEEF